MGGRNKPGPVPPTCVPISHHDRITCPPCFYRNQVLLLENYRMTLEFLTEDKTVWTVDKFLDAKVKDNSMREIIEHASTRHRLYVGNQFNDLQEAILNDIYRGLQMKFDDMIIKMWEAKFPREVPEPCEWGPAPALGHLEYHQWRENNPEKGMEELLKKKRAGREFPNTKLIHFITDTVRKIRSDPNWRTSTEPKECLDSILPDCIAEFAPPIIKSFLPGSQIIAKRLARVKNQERYANDSEGPSYTSKPWHQQNRRLISDTHSYGVSMPKNDLEYNSDDNG